jgi:Holliday junction resolvasome RuvABC DNA-binding subunit
MLLRRINFVFDGPLNLWSAVGGIGSDMAMAKCAATAVSAVREAVHRGDEERCAAEALRTEDHGTAGAVVAALRAQDRAKE